MARAKIRTYKRIPKGARRITGCKRITFHTKRGKPVHVVRCEGKKLRAHNKKQCRRGGRGPKAHLFVKCK